jgi:hypothetical protein
VAHYTVEEPGYIRHYSWWYDPWWGYPCFGCSPWYYGPRWGFGVTLGFGHRHLWHRR